MGHLHFIGRGGTGCFPIRSDEFGSWVWGCVVFVLVVMDNYINHINQRLCFCNSHDISRVRK